MTASLNDTVHGVAPHAPSDAGQGSVPLYFAVSPLKLVVMSVFTFGLYEFYWFYRNWRLVTDREDPGASRAWNVFSSLARAAFTVFFCYTLFMRIQDSADEQEVPVSLASGFLAIGWIVTWFLGGLPDFWGLLWSGSILFLLPVQKAVTRINEAASPGHDPNRRFTLWNIAIVLAGVALIAFALHGTLPLDAADD